MTKYALLFFAIVSQQLTDSKPSPSLTDEKAPVTRAEFVTVFAKFSASITSAFAPTVQPPTFKVKQDQTPATRYEFAIALDAIIAKLQPKFLRPIKPKKLDPKGLKGRAADGSQAAIERLGKGGFLPYGSPILQGHADTFLPVTLAAALAQAAERIGSHFRTADTKPGGN